MTKSRAKEQSPGPILLFGSGETSPFGRKAFEAVFHHLPVPARVALLETPAGFELNSDRVIGRIADFLKQRLQNYQPQTVLVSARKKGTRFSPDDPQVIAPMHSADMIFMGPGSPSYAVRQLEGSLAWNTLLAAHRMGAAVALASAAAVAIGMYALPVYEIYKVGEDIHWMPGLDLLKPFGLSLVFIPHWNNRDGGDELDTSRCFMGLARFEPLLEMLPAGQTVVGIDENTALYLNFHAQSCRVLGQGAVTLLSGQKEEHYSSGQKFPIQQLGPFQIPDLKEDLPLDLWEQVREVRYPRPVDGDENPPARVLELVNQRQSARQDKDWTASDHLREQISNLGWQVVDTPDGQKLERKNEE